MEVPRRKIEKWADKIGVPYEEVMAAADHYVATGEEWSHDAFLSHGMMPGFWDCYEMIRGVELKASVKKDFLICCA